MKEKQLSDKVIQKYYNDLITIKKAYNITANDVFCSFTFYALKLVSH